MKRIPKEENPRKIEYYIKNFPNLTESEHKEKLRLYKRSYNWRYVEYYERLNPDKTREECDKLRLYALNCNKPTKIEYYNKNYPDLSEYEREEMLNKYLENKKKKPEDSEKHWEYYKKRNPELTKDECVQLAYKFRRSCNCRNIEYYERYYPDLSCEEQEKMRSDKLKELKENNSLNINYYIKHYPDLSYEEQEKMRSDKAKASCFQNIEYIKRKNPNLSDEECENLRKEKIKDYVSKRDLFGEKNGMHHSHRTEQQLKENSPWSLEFYKKRNPNLSENECKNLLDKVIKETSKNRLYNTKIEYYINKGMNIDDATLALFNRQRTNTPEKYIEKYGLIDGLQRFKDRQEKWFNKIMSKIRKNGTVAQSSLALSLIYTIENKLNIKMNKEFNLISNDLKHSYFYDFEFNNHIIEFNGDFWHANPSIYSEDWINPITKQMSKDKWKLDSIKLECAKKHGYKILVIWESDTIKNFEKTVKKCLEFLKS